MRPKTVSVVKIFKTIGKELKDDTTVGIYATQSREC